MTAPDHELAQICQSCGFCCDGTLFRAVLLRPDELDRAKRIGLRVLEDKGFQLPCSQLKDLSCQVYEDRPSTCRSFECNLLARHREEGGPVERPLRTVRLSTDGDVGRDLLGRGRGCRGRHGRDARIDDVPRRQLPPRPAQGSARPERVTHWQGIMFGS